MLGEVQTKEGQNRMPNRIQNPRDRPHLQTPRQIGVQAARANDVRRRPDRQNLRPRVQLGHRKGRLFRTEHLHPIEGWTRCVEHRPSGAPRFISGRVPGDHRDSCEHTLPPRRGAQHRGEGKSIVNITTSGTQSNVRINPNRRHSETKIGRSEVCRSTVC